MVKLSNLLLIRLNCRWRPIRQPVSRAFKARNIVGRYRHFARAPGPEITREIVENIGVRCSCEEDRQQEDTKQANHCRIQMGLFHDSLRRLCRMECFVDWLIVMHRFSQHTPAIVISSKSYSRAVTHAGVVESTADFIYRNPMP